MKINFDKLGEVFEIMKGEEIEVALFLREDGGDLYIPAALDNDGELRVLHMHYQKSEDGSTELLDYDLEELINQFCQDYDLEEDEHIVIDGNKSVTIACRLFNHFNDWVSRKGG